MSLIHMAETVGLLGDCVGSYFASLLAWKLSRRKLKTFASNLKINYEVYKKYTESHGSALVLWPYVFVFTCLYGARK